MSQLSEHFTLEEFTRTDSGLPNIADPEEIDKLRTLAAFMEKVRAALGGHPITVNSAFRSEAVNTFVGGVPDSAHRLALACDFTCPAFGSPLMIAERLDTAAKNGAIAFDQLIQEGTWVHISRDQRLRGERLTLTAAGQYIEGIHPS